MSIKWAVLLGAVAVGLSQPSAHRGAVFTKDGELAPTGFREWSYIGGPITPNGLDRGDAPFPEFHDVYIELDNLRYYQTHGNFQDGTVIVKELALAQMGSTPMAPSTSLRAEDISRALCTA